MILKKIVLFILLILSQYIHAQNYNTIKIVGTIVDTAGNPLHYANVAILNPTDSTIVNMDVSYNGIIELEIDNIKHSLLMVSSIGYSNEYVYIAQADTTASIGKIVMKPSVLEIEEVIVTATVPVVRRSGGKITINVASTFLVHLPTIFDIIGKAPGVLVKGEEIKVWGRGTPVLYIDGKKINSYSELTTLQPNEIVSFQVDKNPSALYAADVTSVISIKTNRGAVKGYSLQLYNSSIISREYSNVSGAKINLNHKKIRGHIGYTFDNLRNKDYQQNYDSNTLPSGLFQINDSTNNRYIRNNHNLTVGLEYDFNNKHNLSAQYIYTGRVADMDKTSVQHITRDKVLDDILNVQTGRIGDVNTNIFSLNYKITHNSKWETNFWSDYIFINSTLNQDITELSDKTNNDISINNIANSDAFSIKAESKYRINDNIGLIFGTRYGMCQSLTNTLTQELTSLYSREVSNIYENNLAAYFLYSQDFSKIGYEIGLRAEATKNRTAISDLLVRDISELDLLPYVKVYTSELFEDIDLSLSYMNKVARPTFTQYNPIMYYLNSYSYNIGNPTLISTKQYSFSFDITLFENLSLWASYDYFKNPIVQAGVQDLDNPEITRYTPINIDKSKSWDIGVSYNNRWKWFDLGITSGVTIPNTNVPYLSTIIHNNELSHYAQLSLSIKLAKNSYFSTSYNYQSKSVDLITQFTPSHDLCASITQYFCKRKLSLTLSANDILRKSYSGWVEKYGNIEIRQNNSMDSRNLQITLRYNFKNFKNNYKKQTNYNQELEKLQ